MFKHRATHFIDRLGWGALQRDENGWELDQYDLVDPLYVIWCLEDGTHGASMRLLPMSGRNMLHEQFPELVPRSMYRSTRFLECSRFLVAKEAGSLGVYALYLGAGELFRNSHVEGFLACFSKEMLTVYKRSRNPPRILSSVGTASNWLGAGIWQMSEDVWKDALSRLGVTTRTSRSWYAHQDLGTCILATHQVNGQ
jgi:acyl homoserine lactone synthase